MQNENFKSGVPGGRQCVLTLVAWLLLVSGALHADELTLVTGESMRGKVTGTESGGFLFDPRDATARLVPYRDLYRVNFGPSRPKGPLQVRYVRIDLPGKDKYLHVRELQVFVGDKNVAIEGQARQSTTFVWNKTQHPPELAFDQKLETFNHTADLTNPWLEVDLLKPVTPTKIVVLNRVDENLQHRLNGFRVLLFNENWELLWARTTPKVASESMEFVIPPTGEQIEPQDVAEIENYVGRPGPWTPPLLSEPQEFVWFEDDIPEGARPWENWNFNSQQPVFAGTKATTRVGTGIIQDVFEGASYQLRVGEGDKFFVMVYLDPENPPKSLMLQFNDGLTWEHRAYWGADVITWGSGDNDGHRRIGDLPPVGKWVRLEVDAARVGCPAGSRINGWTCTQMDGKCYWDHGGIVTRTPQDEPRPRFFQGDDLEWTLRSKSVFTGTVEKWDSKEIVLNTHLSTVNLFPLPITSLHEAWRKPTPNGTFSVNRLAEDLSMDHVYVQTSSGIQRASGEIRGQSEGSLQLLHEGEVRRISREKIVGIVFRKSEPVTAPEYSFRVMIHGERVFAGQLAEFTPRLLKLNTPEGAELLFPRSIVRQIEVVNGRMIHLADLKPSAVEETPYFDQHWNYQVNKSLTGQPLKVGKTTFSHGLAMHSRSVLSYDLSGNYSRLLTRLGLQAGEGDIGNAGVRVLVDGRTLFEKKGLTKSDNPEVVDLDLTGCNVLQLEVDFGANFDVGDHVTWGEPVLVHN